MGRTEVSNASILIASDSTVDAELVKSLLEDEFGRLAISVDTDTAAQDVQLHRPDVLLLAFKDLEKAEQFYLGLFRLGIHGRTPRHRALILCTQQQIRPAYALCRRGLFDDYVVFWPWTHDVTRLPMSIHRAIKELAGLTDAGAPPGAWPTQERPPVKLNTVAPVLSAGNGPLQPATRSAEEVQFATDRQPGASTPCRTILVVDDDELHRELAGRLLKAHGFDVHYAGSGGEALGLLASKPTDLILMDFLMPDMDGLEAIKRLSAEDRLARIPVIMITGNSERDLVLTSVRMGAVDFIVKPWDRATLMAKIWRALETGTKLSNAT
jgi:CheY-like chemotaxis protein